MLYRVEQAQGRAVGGGAITAPILIMVGSETLPIFPPQVMAGVLAEFPTET